MIDRNHDRDIEDYAGWIADGLGKPARKFVRDMLHGIHVARSIKLTDIAAALAESNAVHSTHNRLSRNLGAHPGMAECIRDRILEEGARAVREHTRLILHVHAITKPHAKKMEYLHDVSGPQQADQQPDQSSAAMDSYHVCEILASDTGSDAYVPLLTRLWSRRAPGYESDSGEILDAVRRVLVATNGRGVVCMDDLFMPASVVEELIGDFVSDGEVRFMTSLEPQSRILSYRGQQKTCAELGELCSTPHGVTIYKAAPQKDLGPRQEDDGRFESVFDLFDKYYGAAEGELADMSIAAEFGSLPVRHVGSSLPLRLIGLRTRHPVKGTALQTLLTTQVGSRSRRSTLEPLEWFFTIADVVAGHRRIRISYDPEALQVMTYERIQLLMTLLHGVLFFEAGSVRLATPMSGLQAHSGKLRRDFLLPGDIES